MPESPRRDLPPATLEDPRGAEVAESAKALGVALGLSRWYGPGHPRTRDATRDALEGLTALTERYGIIELATDPDGFLWRGLRVYRDLDDSRGFGRLLHGAGIEALDLDGSISLDSLLALFELLGINLDLPAFEEESLEMLLWQANLPGVGFRVVPELGDAELLSGRLANEGDEAFESYEREVADPDPTRDEIRELSRLESDLASMGPVPVLADVMTRRPPLPAELANEEDGDEWSRRVRELGARDAVRDLIAAIEEPGDAEHLARLCATLFQVAGEERPEMPAPLALARAHDALDAIYALGDPDGLTALYRDARRLGKSEAQGLTRGGREAARFMERACRPREVMKMLEGCDPDDADGVRDCEALLEALPDEDLQAVVEATAQHDRDLDFERVVAMVARIVGPRIESWFEAARRHPPERLAPIIDLMRLGGRSIGASHRDGLLAHPSPLVRCAALRWCLAAMRDPLPPAVLERLLDRDRAVRDLAHRLIRPEPRPECAAWFVERLDDGSLEGLDRDARHEFCVTFGRVAGRPVAQRLVQRLRDGTGLRIDKAERRVLLDIAIILVASGDPRAIAAVEGEAAGLAPHRRLASRKALRIVASDEEVPA